LRKPLDYRLWLLALWVGSRLWLWGVGLLAPLLVKAAPGFQPPFHGWLGMFHRFDSVRYLEIAQQGYFMAAQGPGGWFPGYPLLIRLLGFFDVSLLAGVLVSNLAFLGALFCLYHLFRLDLEETATRRALLLLVAFPSAFLSSCIYSEASFLLFTSASVLALRRGHWLGSVLLAAGAAAIRPQGCLLAPLLLWERWRSQEGHARAELAWIVLVPLTVLAFFAFLQRRLGYFLTYINIQRELGLQLGVGEALAQNRALLPEHQVGLAFLVLEVALLVWGWSAMRTGDRCYVLLCIAMALSHTQGLCTHRFMWVLFPLYYQPARQLTPRATGVVLLLGLLLQATLFMLWVQGYRTTY
jgi:hypothetical protein